MTPQFLRALQTEILSRPECALYVHTNDDPSRIEVLQDGVLVIEKVNAYSKDKAIADILNAAGWGASSRAVSCHLAKKLLIKRGRWRAIVLASQDNEHAAVESAYAAVALAEDARMEADFCDASATGLMAPLVSSGLLSAEDVAALQALCRVPSAVTAEQVSRAMRGPWGDEA